MGGLTKGFYTISWFYKVHLWISWFGDFAEAKPSAREGAVIRARCQWADLWIRLWKSRAADRRWQGFRSVAGYRARKSALPVLVPSRGGIAAGGATGCHAQIRERIGGDVGAVGGG